VVVIGGGAAGLMCAAEAGRRGRRVLLLEHNESVGRKIGISGGGRCNFTNTTATWEAYLSRQPAFCKSALARYTPADFIALVEKHRIRYHEKKLGQQFCDGSSRAIIDLLLAECAAAGVTVEVNCRVDAVTKPERFRLETSRGEIAAEAVVIATGGLSVAKLGATDFGHRLARKFGLRLTELRPGLVPLTLGRDELRVASALSGVSLPVEIAHGEARFAESLLFTHRGLSGPVILQISSYWREGEELRVNLLPDEPEGERLARARRENTELLSIMSQVWPRRFAEAWEERHRPKRRLPQLSREDLAMLADALHRWTVRPTGTEGYAKAEVTLGGVETSELSSQTMEAKKVPGLYFIGEVVDVTGWLGGYNFQWAWASGYAAGQAA
jgi:predicted Rossmann fold flavoprotein